MILIRKRLVCLCLACILALSVLPCLASADTGLAEWTVMLYLCGTDLESENMAATVNLGEICQTTSTDAVNLLIETGGTEAWHTLEVFDGLDIAADKLQRYAYRDEGYTLVDEQPLANMADASTLTSFIRWTAANYPAKKYALVLWDHGGGSFSGIISDELHGGAIMQIDDLARALQDTGMTFEVILPDACLMATLEVAQVLAPYANYLIASEEIVPNEGGPYAEWLQYLYDEPGCDGAALGKKYDQAILKKYAAISETTEATVTYSTIDLKKIDAVSTAFDKMFTEISTLLSDPQLFNAFGYDTQHTQTFAGIQYDLVDLATRAGQSVLLPETVEAVVSAVKDAVIDNVHGSARLGANGLSFYYAPKDSVTRLDHYARVCKSAPYLAFLDRVNMGWSAPQWVYEQIERQPDISRRDYVVVGEASLNEEGLPTFTLTSGLRAATTVDAVLYRYDPQQEEYVKLGTDVNVLGTFDEGVFRYMFDSKWLTINGRLAQMSIKEERETHTLYSIPFITTETLEALINNGKNYEFRVSYDYDTDIETLATDPDAQLTGTYTVHGVWNMTDTASDLPSRDVWDVGDFDGDTLMLLQDVVNIYSGQTISHNLGDAFFFRSEEPKFAVETLPSGAYAMAFVVTDVFGTQQRTAPFEIHWDAKEQTVSYAELE